MSDFTSPFWSWFIALVTVLSIAALLWLIRWTSRGSKKPGEKIGTMGHVWDEDLEELNNPLPRWWLIMFYLTLVFGVAYLLLYPGLGTFKGLLGWTQLDQYQDEVATAEAEYGPLYEKFHATSIAALVNDPAAVQIGERLFSTYCTTCHGSDARGVRGFPNLRDDDWLYGGTPEDIEHTILDGRNGVMPGWQAALGEAGVFEVAEYVTGLSGREVDPVVAGRGKQHYAQYCAACHGPDGTGNTQLGAPNLADNIWLHGGTQKRIQETIAKGRNSHMPPHREFLGEARVHLLAAYVFGLRVDANIRE
jgi:cytochrome c oxidase cbb3-type subunit 3